MKKNKIDINTVLICLITFVNSYLSGRVNIIIFTIVFAYLLFKSGMKIKLSIPGIRTYIYFLVVGVTIGFLSLNKDSHVYYVYFKHIYYCLQLFIYMYFGYIISKRNESPDKTINDLLLAFLICVSIDLVKTLIALPGASFNSIYKLRSVIGKGTVLSSFAVYILLVYKDFINLNKSRRTFWLIISLVDTVIHFSRTNLLALAVLFLYSDFIKNKRKLLKIVICLFAIVLLIYLITPNYFSMFMAKVASSFTEIKSTNNGWDFATINKNWRGYELSLEIEKFNKASIIEKILGGGFGTTLDAKGYSYLVSDEPYLSFMHNGYATILMVWGGLGVLLYFIWIFKLIKISSCCRNKKNVNFIKAVLLFLLLITYTNHGPFFSSGCAIYLMYYMLLLQ